MLSRLIFTFNLYSSDSSYIHGTKGITLDTGNSQGWWGILVAGKKGMG